MQLLLCGVALIIAPAVVWGNLYFTTRLKERNRRLADERGKLNAWQMEMLSGMEEVKLLCTGEYICGEHKEGTEQMKRLYSHLLRQPVWEVWKKNTRGSSIRMVWFIFSRHAWDIWKRGGITELLLVPLRGGEAI